MIEGVARVGSTLRISKSFQTSTSPVWRDDFGTVIGDEIQFPDTLNSELKATAPTFTWHVNPSTRPIVVRVDPLHRAGPADGVVNGWFTVHIEWSNPNTDWDLTWSTRPVTWSRSRRRSAIPPRLETGVKESWTLTCTGSDGNVKATRQVTVDRGQRVQVGNACTRSK